MTDSTQLVRAVAQLLLICGAVIYGIGSHFGWPAGVGAGAGVAALLYAIFTIGRRNRPRYSLDDIRAKAAKRWACRKCGTQAAPQSTMCLTCGASF